MKNNFILEENRGNYFSYINDAVKYFEIGDIDLSIKTMIFASKFAWENYTGIYRDEQIEKLIYKISGFINQQFPLKFNSNQELNKSYLLTGIYSYGGHSKIAWRWMQLDKQTKFSVVLTEQLNQVPIQLTELIESGQVSVIKIRNDINFLDRVIDCRNALSSSGLIVNSTNPDDVVGAIAVACLCENTPIVFFNHAYFTFSIGLSFCNVICTTSPAATKIAIEQRSISPEHFIWYRNSIEEFKTIFEPEISLRDLLNIKKNTKILLSSASEYKYYPLRNINFFEIIEPILSLSNDVVLIVVGVSADLENLFCFFSDEVKNKIIILPPVPERTLSAYIRECDIYLDSLPFNSGGAAQQAMIYAKPTLYYCDEITYQSGLAPQFYSVDDFSWFHFSIKSYRLDLLELINSSELCKKRGIYLSQQVVSRVNADLNLLSIELAYKKAKNTPLVMENFTGFCVNARYDCNLHTTQIELTKNYSLYRERMSNLTLTSSQGAQIKSLEPIKIIAFYLPQFHTIPENNQWWGDGFTEWTNVRAAKPLFDGHDQPHIPSSDVGYYDLSEPDVLIRQAAMAKQYGIHGFCFYHYWFDGKRLLEKPVDMLLAHPEIDLPFCLCWANENWTRRWDGGNEYVLIAQRHSAASNQRFATDLLPYLRDQRYIKINSKPLILIYRPDLIPDLNLAVQKWRSVWREAGIGEVFLANVQSFTADDPREIDFDAAVEFPPQLGAFSSFRPDYPQYSRVDPLINLASYPKMAKMWAERPSPEYLRFRTVMPAWDNTSRRQQGGASVLVDSSPDCYREWLNTAIAHTVVEKVGDEQLIFINAWNEWAEGCHLEPDQQNGYAYLEATHAALDAAGTILLPVDDLFSDWLNQSKLDKDLQEHILISLQQAHHNLPSIIYVIDGLSTDLNQINNSLKSILPLLSLLPVTIIVLTQQENPQISISNLLWLQTDSIPQSFWQELGQLHSGRWIYPLQAGDRLVYEQWLQFLMRWTDYQDRQLIYSDELSLDNNGEAMGLVIRTAADRLSWLSLPVQGRHALVSAQLLAVVDAQEQIHFNETYLLQLILVAARSQGLIHLEQLLIARPAVESQIDVTTALTICQQELSQSGIKLDVVTGLRLGSSHFIGQDIDLPKVQVLLPVDRTVAELLPTIEHLLANTNYPQWELVLLADQVDTQSESLLLEIASIAPERIRVCRVNQNPASTVTMLQNASADYVVLWSAQLSALHQNWLRALITPLANFEELVASGGMLLSPSGEIISAGIVLGGSGVVDHYLQGCTLSNAPLMQTQSTRLVSALDFRGIALKLSKNNAFKAIPNDLKDIYAAAEVAILWAEQGGLCWWTPYAPLQWDAERQQTTSSVANHLTQLRQRFCERRFTALSTDPYFSRFLSEDVSGVYLRDCQFGEQIPATIINVPRIIVLPTDFDGSGQYRIFKPAHALNENGQQNVIVANALPSPAELARSQPDAIILQKLLIESDIDHLRNLRRCRELWSVFEIDDYLSSLPSASPHRAHMYVDITKRIRKGLSVCDRLLVSTEPLADAMSKFHSNIMVARNYLCPQWWSVQRQSILRVDARLRVGWAGGVSHMGDVNLLRKAVQVLGNQVQWVFMGMLPDWMPLEWVEYHAPIDVENYPQRLAQLDLDLALAPLEINLFNRCKSNLKLLEYGICGYPVLASDLDPYRGDLPVTLVPTNEDAWLQAIKARLNDHDQLLQEGQRLREKILSEYMLEGNQLAEWRAGWLPD